MAKVLGEQEGESSRISHNSSKHVLIHAAWMYLQPTLTHSRSRGGRDKLSCAMIVYLWERIACTHTVSVVRRRAHRLVSICEVSWLRACVCVCASVNWRLH